MAQFQGGSASGPIISSAEIDTGLRAHMNKVYRTMSAGMVITALAAWAIAGLATTVDPATAAVNSEGARMALRNGEFLTSLGAAIYTSPLAYVIMFAPLVMLFLFGGMMQRASNAVAQVFFYLFVTIKGVALSSIFLIYTDFSIVQTFLITAVAFAGLSIWGYTTKKDISGWGSFLMMGLIGLIVAMIVNVVLNIMGFETSAMEFAISVIGVLIFAGLTAYDTQYIKNYYLAYAHAGDQDRLDAAATVGALHLYINFIVMFQFLLSLIGNQE